VDGIRTGWVEAARPFTAALSLRVGIYDEDMAHRGITHLVEHLALSSTRDMEIDFNGSVDGRFTTIQAQGHPALVGDFLAAA
jgi:predicted Zn-dependent peptidase